MRSLFAALLCAAFLPGTVWGQGAGLVMLPSKYSVTETMNRFDAAVKNGPPGFQVFLRVDFQEVAASQGGKVRPEQLILFGRGSVLQDLLPQSPLAAIDFPLKALAWEDEAGKIWLAYQTGEYLAERHGLKGKDEVRRRLSAIAARFAKAATE
jgi:uncharacterized protein (DUF302 family)